MSWNGNETLGAEGYAALAAQFERDEQMANRFGDSSVLIGSVIVSLG